VGSWKKPEGIRKKIGRKLLRSEEQVDHRSCGRGVIEEGTTLVLDPIHISTPRNLCPTLAFKTRKGSNQGNKKRFLTKSLVADGRMAKPWNTDYWGAVMGVEIKRRRKKKPRDEALIMKGPKLCVYFKETENAKDLQKYTQEKNMRTWVKDYQNNITKKIGRATSSNSLGLSEGEGRTN